MPLIVCAQCGKDEEILQEEYNLMVALYQRRFGDLPPEFLENPLCTCDDCTRKLLGEKGYQMMIDLNKEKLN